jgi:hypothetical protein
LVSAEGPEALGEALQLKRLSICSQSIGHILVAVNQGRSWLV